MLPKLEMPRERYEHETYRERREGGPWILVHGGKAKFTHHA
jgi:hypothetical protein